jgi:hypothetical protein
MQLVLEEVGPLQKRANTACDNMEDTDIPLTPEPSISSAEIIGEAMHDDFGSQNSSSLMDEGSLRYV